MDSDAKKELWIGIFFLVLSAAYMIGTTTISTFTPFGNRGLDSRSVPLLIGFLALVLASVQIVTTLLKEKKRRVEASLHATEDVHAKSDVAEVQREITIFERIDNVVPIKLILSFVFLVIYIAAYQSVGFILASTFFLMAESFILVENEQRKKWRIFIIVFSIAASLFIYFVFTNYLSLFLPKGILG